MNPIRATTQTSSLGFMRFLPDNLRERMVHVASFAFRYVIPATIAAGTAYFLGLSSLGRFRICLLSGGILAGVGVYTFVSVRDILRGNVPLNKLATKADRLARTIIWSLMISGALMAGLAGGCCISGASFLYAGAQIGSALPIIQGLSDLFFTLGYTVPVAYGLLRGSTFLYDAYNKLVKVLQAAVADFRRDPRTAFNALLLQQRLGTVFIERFDFDSIMQVAHHVPEPMFREQFLVHLPSFSNEKISSIIDRFPNILTVEFLAQNLSKEQFYAIVAPKLTCPVGVEELNVIGQDIETWKKQLTKLENEVQDKPEKLRQAEGINSVLIEHRKRVLLLRGFINRLPERDLPAQYLHLQEGINTARKLKDVAELILKNLTDEKEADSLTRRLQAIRSSCAQETAVDMEEPNYEVLGAYGFTIANFRTLGELLKVDMGNQEIQRTSEYLDKCGLQSRGDLIKHGILNKPDGKELDRATIIERIVTHCKGSPVEAPQKEGVAAPVAAPSPQQAVVAPQPRWARVSRVVNFIFHVTMTVSLLAVQLYYLPLSTAAGFILRLFYNPSQNPFLAGMSKLFQPPPDYIRQGFFERMRYLYNQIWTTSFSLAIGPIGGFITGAIHADAASLYLQRWIGRIERRPPAGATSSGFLQWARDFRADIRRPNPETVLRLHARRLVVL